MTTASTSGQTSVIVGASLAGAKAAETLREDFDGRVVFRGDPAGGIASWLHDGCVPAGMSPSIWEPIQGLVRSGRCIPAERLTASAIPLGELASSRRPIQGPLIQHRERR